MLEDIGSLLRHAQQAHAAGQLDQAEAGYSAALRRDPNHVLARLRLSEVLQAGGKFRASRAAVLAAEKAMRAQRKWDGLPFVTMQLMVFEETELVREAILAADPSDPAVLRHSHVLSQHLWLCGAYDEALRLIDDATAAVGANPLLSFSRASALRFAGRADEATAELERCIAMAPAHPQAHWMLAYHQKSKTPGERVPRLLQAKMRVPPGDPGQVFLDFALFKEYDDADDVGAAWAALDRGMRGKRAKLGYDATAERAALERLASGVLQAPAASVAMVGPADRHRPVFVVGLPRTGTTLLEQLLANHADVASAGESADLAQAIGWEVDAFVGSPPPPGLQARIEAADAAAIGARYLSRTASAARGKAVLVDKNPSNLFHAALIARALPSARILCLVRDPMDACFSNLKELFPGRGYGYSYDLSDMAAHHRAFSGLVEAFAKQLPGQFLRVSYESLAADPERALGPILAACDLPPQAGLADLSDNRRAVLTASASQVRGAVHTGNVGAWRRYARQLEPLRALLEA